MSVILIQDESGESSIRELSKQLPVAVGRHSSNDIQVSEPEVGILHCRISWNSRAYEVIAGTPTGVDVNGDWVPSAILTPGDCIQVGSYGIFYYENEVQLEAALRGESIDVEETAEVEESQARSVRRKKKSDREQERPGSAIKSVAATEKKQKQPPRLTKIKKAAPSDEVPWEEAPAESEPELPLPQQEQADKQDSLSKAAQSASLFGGARVRPGEQDLLRSPLVLSLGIGTAVLVMVSIALWFVIGRDSSHKAYQLAVDEMEQKRYTQAIAQFSEFLKNYPNHQYASAARHALALSQVEQPLAGAVPDWTLGLENLNEYLEQRKRDKDFAEMSQKVADLAERIAKGAAETAGIQKQPELLKISSDATRLLQAYSPTDAPPKQALLEIDEAVQTAESSIRKHDTFQTALVEMDRELKAQHPFAAFEIRRKLLLKYSALESDKSLRSRLKQMLDLERILVVKQAVDQPAQTAEPAQLLGGPPLVLMRHSRTRPDTLVNGTNVFTLVHETCVAADSATGFIQWRRVIGMATPFAPQAVSLDVLGLLLFDVRRNELLLVKQRDGALIWRQPLPDPASAAPLVHAGQIFIPTRSGKLYQLDLVSGKLLAVLTFSQPISASPILVQNGERLLVAGDRSVLYTLNYRPLECVAVSYSGHAASSIQAPLLKMGDFVLLAENDRQDSARLRVWQVLSDDAPLVELTSARVSGQVREPAVLRGKQLIVPSNPERIASFTVSDEKGEKALTAAGTYQVELPRGSPISITLGPDNEMWMTSSLLRRLQIGPDSLQPDKGQFSLGISTQPVQSLDQTLFATSRIPSNSSVSFLCVDRRDFISHWQLVLGGRAIAVATASSLDGSIPLLLDTGDVFAVAADKLKAGGMDSHPVATLSLPTGLNNPLQGAQLANGKLVAWCDGPQPHLWQFNPDGIVTRESKLPGNLEAPPISLSGGILCPLRGKLKLIEAPGFTAAVEDLMPPIDPKQPTRWRGLVPIDDKQLVAVNDQGRVLRAQVHTEPVPHLAEITAFELKQTVDRAPVAIGSTVYIVTGKILRGLDMVTLEPRGERELVDTVAQGPWVVGNQLVMVCGRDQLVTVDVNGTLPVRWTQKLTGGSLSGSPLLKDDRLILASHSGHVEIRKLSDGELVKSAELGQSFTLGPCVLQEHVFVVTQDGCVKSLDSWLEAVP